MIKPGKRAQGCLLLALAVFCFWLGSYFRTPLEANHKLLVASSKENDDAFKGAVVFIVRHDPTGAFGLVLNKKSFGGPVEEGQSYILHSTDVLLKGSSVLPDLGIAYASGDAAVAELKAATKKPQWQAVLKGYAGWGPRQLEREIGNGVWKVIDYDPKLVMDTPASKLFVAANKRPAKNPESDQQIEP